MGNYKLIMGVLQVFFAIHFDEGNLKPFSIRFIDLWVGKLEQFAALRAISAT